GSMLLNIGHSGPEQPQYVAWLRRRGLRPVFMIHDVIPVTHPEYCRPPERQRHMRRLDAVLRTASAVITNSRATLRALSEYSRSPYVPTRSWLHIYVTPRRCCFPRSWRVTDCRWPRRSRWGSRQSRVICRCSARSPPTSPSTWIRWTH